MAAAMLSTDQLLSITGTVAAYRNLNFRRATVYSLQDKRAKRVVGYTPTLTLRNVTFRIVESGRQRAVLEHQRNVHAFADGTVTTTPDDLTGFRPGRYNPFKFDTFVDTDTETPILTARLVHLGPDGLLYLP